MPKVDKYTWVCGSINKPEQFNRLIEGLKEQFYYAYIYHDSDTYNSDDELVKSGIAALGDKKPKHLHFICNSSPKALKTWSNQLGIPDFMIEICHTPKGATKYLTHKNAPKKHQYSIQDIVTSDMGFFKSYYDDSSSIDNYSIYSDLCLLKTHRMTAQEFFDKYNFEVSRLPFYSRFKFISEVFKMTDS